VTVVDQPGRRVVAARREALEWRPRPAAWAEAGADLNQGAGRVDRRRTRATLLGGRSRCRVLPRATTLAANRRFSRWPPPHRRVKPLRCVLAAQGRRRRSPCRRAWPPTRLAEPGERKLKSEVALRSNGPHGTIRERLRRLTASSSGATCPKDVDGESSSTVASRAEEVVQCRARRKPSPG